MVVLVVEDETLVCMFMADFLDEARFKVFEAVNADEALTVLQARPDIQAVVTDIEMSAGSMNGLNLARTIQERWPGLRVVITSGRERPGPDDLSDMIAFIAKPYLPDTIITVIRQMAIPQVIKPLWSKAPDDPSCSVDGGIQGDRREDSAGRIHDIEPPALPRYAELESFVPDVVDGLECHVLRRGQIRDLNADVIRDGLVPVHQVEVAAHRQSLKPRQHHAAQPEPRSEPFLLRSYSGI